MNLLTDKIIIDREKSDPVALKYFDKGINPKYSTGIDGGDTGGYGKLSDLGYWEFPLAFVEGVKNCNPSMCLICKRIFETELAYPEHYVCPDCDEKLNKE